MTKESSDSIDFTVGIESPLPRTEKRISIVATLYQSEKYIQEFVSRCLVSLKKITDNYEFVFVNDGSSDSSAEVVHKLLDEGLPGVLVDLTRNFGHHKAIVTGLRHATGNYVFLIDVDLEEQPETLEIFWRKLCENPKLALVYGFQTNRKGDWMERYINGAFYSLFNLMCAQKIPNNLVLARLMSRAFVNDLLSLREVDVLLGGLCAWVGNEQLGVPIKKGHKKKTTYNLSRKLAVITDSITSYSAKPLEAIFYVGLFISSLSIVVTSWVLLKRLILGQILEGWTSVMVSIWLLGGLILLCLGVVGIYIARIYNQVKERPLSLVKELYKKDKAKDLSSDIGVLDLQSSDHVELKKVTSRDSW